MSASTDKVKGRIKEAAGALKGDSSMKREGKADQVSGTVKSAADKAKRKVEGAVDAVKDRIASDKGSSTKRR